jgi:hypothetical protein
MIWKLRNTTLWNAVKAKKCYVVNGNHHWYVCYFFVCMKIDFILETAFRPILKFEDGTDRLAQSVGKKLPLLAVK